MVNLLVFCGLEVAFILVYALCDWLNEGDPMNLHFLFSGNCVGFLKMGLVLYETVMAGYWTNAIIHVTMGTFYNSIPI